MLVVLFCAADLLLYLCRIDVGGKLLTNLLKETISYRKFNLMDETHLMNSIKERLCYVSLDFVRDLQVTASSNNTIRREYVFPNGTTRLIGYVRGEDDLKDAKVVTGVIGGGGDGTARKLKINAMGQVIQGAGGAIGLTSKSGATANNKMSDESSSGGGDDSIDESQVLVMNNERIAIPEVLFHPSDIGMKQSGIAETIVASIAACPVALQPLMYSNIILVGGNTLLPNFTKRIQSEVRSAAPSDYPVSVRASSAPLTTTWSGASNWASVDAESLMAHSITRSDYNELGAELCARKFL